MATVNYYTALLRGRYWNGIRITGSPVIVTFLFPTTLSAHGSYCAALPSPEESVRLADPSSDPRQGNLGMESVSRQMLRGSIEFTDHIQVRG